MARFQENTDKMKEGYNRIHDSITNAKSIAELTKAIEASLPIIQQSGLDFYQQQKLEQYGFKKYEALLREQNQIEHERKTNKFKK